jgi:ribokinase
MPPIVLSAGSVNVDFQVRTDRWPGPGETLPAREFLMTGGGKAANVAYLVRRLGGDAHLLAHVGDDDLAPHALRSLEQAGVDVSGVRHVAGQTTGVALIDVGSDGDKAILMAGNANDSWTSADEESLAAAIDSAPRGSVLAVDLEMPERVVRRAMDAARRAGCTIVLDPSPADRLTDDLCGMADFLTPNAGEAWALTDVLVRSREDGFRAGERLLERGARTVLVKLGGGGCALVSRHKCLAMRPTPRAAVDTTGAGDAFTGALAVGLIEARPVESAVKMAVAASAFSVTRFGAQPSYPSRQDLDRELAEVSVS